jgi:murein DD-endopeptidase MepM/ murein hydrolase activator NlpD
MMAGDRAKGTNGIAANEKLFSGLSARIENVNASQHAMLVDIHRAASARNAKIAKVLKRLHVPLPEGAGENGGDNSQMGGPFIAASLASFDSNIETLDGTLDELDTMTARLDKVPLANPAPGHPVTSTFGVRIDPFLKREAMHTGIDFGAPIGMRVKATAAGTVVEADRNGGYGNMVEIDHGGGIATRYAHLSAIMVKVGQKVERGTVIGLVGSTGRSTGPHLHYEVRRKGNAVNPARYLKAGRELAGII